MKKKNSDLNLDKLKRDKYSKPEAKFEWLYSALAFGKTKKIVITTKH